jgi:hypothetical protein
VSETDHALSAGNVRSDAIEKLPVALVYGLGTSLAFMRVIILRLRENVETKKLNLVRRQKPQISTLQRQLVKS